MEALSDINVQNATDIMHILFEIEDKHTIDIERIGGKTAIIIDDDMRNNILNIYLNYWYDKRQVFSLDKYSDNKDPRVIEYKSWRGRFSSHETDFENSILQNIRESQLEDRYSSFSISISTTFHGSFFTISVSWNPTLL